MSDGSPAVEDPGEGSLETDDIHIDDVFDTTDQAPEGSRTDICQPSVVKVKRTNLANLFAWAMHHFGAVGM